jgi:DNA-binding CsgD family transcriptional regulator
MPLTGSYIQAIKEQVPVQEIERLLDPHPSLCVAIKSHKEGYVYANQNFLTLVGFKSGNQIVGKFDDDLCSDKKLLKLYRDFDENVFDTQQPVLLEGDMKPHHVPKLVKSMRGVSHPLSLNSFRTDAVFMMTEPVNGLITISLAVLCTMTSHELQKVLTRSSYAVKAPFGEIRLARMELLCFAEVLKGKHAGEIADILGLKQVTVETYLSNMRNKCRVYKKSDLAEFIATNKILESIIV